jgi:PIN domain nuclease of toxin-antitoxin system
MNLLVDTHALIWFITDNNKLPINTRKFIESNDNDCYVSIATFWEIGIKNSIGRLDLNSDLQKIFQIIEESGFDILPITTSHILQNADLELYHQDPFDRIIIAQAIVEKMTIITIDSEFNKYNIPIMWER